MRMRSQNGGADIPARRPRRLFQLSLLAALIALTAHLWPLNRETLIPVQNSEGNYGLITPTGRFAISPKWDDAQPPDSEGMICIESDSQFGWIDRSGKTIIGLTPGDHYMIVYRFDSKGMAVFPERSKYGFYDRTGKIVIQPVWDYTYGFDDSDFAPVQRNNLKWGFINRSGETVIEPTWDDVKPFGSSNLAPVRSGGLWGCIDRNGDLVISPQWDWMDAFDSKGFAAVRLKNGWTWIDQKGKTAAVWDAVGAFDQEGMAPVMKDGKVGWVATDGTVVIAPQWYNYGFRLNPSNQWGKQFPLPDEFDSCGWAMVRTAPSSGTTWIDRTGAVKLETSWYYVSPFDRNGLAKVREDGPHLDPFATNFAGWIDRKGNHVIPLDPDDSWSARESETSGFYGVSRSIPPTWLNKKLASLKSYFQKSPTPTRSEVTLYHCYNAEGTLIYSSAWILFETKCKFALAAALLLALLTRPKPDRPRKESFPPPTRLQSTAA